MQWLHANETRPVHAPYYVPCGLGLHHANPNTRCRPSEMPEGRVINGGGYAWLRPIQGRENNQFPLSRFCDWAIA